MQECADVGDVGVGDRDQGVPLADGRRPAVAQRQVIFVLVNPGVGRIEVGVDGRQRGEGRPDPDDRAGRRVPHDGQVGVDGERPGPGVERAPVQEASVRYVLAPVGETQALPVDGQRLSIVSHLGQDQGGGAPGGAIFPALEVDGVVGLAGRIVEGLHDAHEGCGAEHHRGRALEHLDALHIVHVPGGDHRVERAAPRHAVDHQQEGVELVKAPERRHGAGRTGVAAGGRFHARDQSQRRGHVP